jgi:hypothetical protein
VRQVDKRIREQLRAIESEGFKVTHVEAQGNTHLRAYIRTRLGERFFILPTSPGNDATGAANIVRGHCRKLRRELEQKKLWKTI